MPGFKSLSLLALLAPAAIQAAPMHARQAPAAPAPAVTDADILQFALTLEHLEAEFYRQGFAKFPDTDFQALGLNDKNIATLKKVGETEATHVSFLQTALAGAGAKPVEQCQYEFGLTDAASMVATAKILEAVGVAAYLGAAPLVSDPAILGAAASIATIEARHQTFIRTAQSTEAIPAAFDVALGVRAVFTLAAPFITSCPEGSNLAITPFPAIALQNPEAAVSGNTLTLTNQQQSPSAAFCAFATSGGTQFAPLANGACTVPQGIAGEVYMMVTDKMATDDASILAGPSVIQAS